MSKIGNIFIRGKVGGKYRSHLSLFYHFILTDVKEKDLCSILLESCTLSLIKVHA